MQGWFRFSLRSMLVLVVLVAIIVGIAVRWPQTVQVVFPIGPPHRSKTVCLACPQLTCYESSQAVATLFLPLYGDAAMPVEEIIDEGFSGPVETLVVVRWGKKGPIRLEAVDVKTGRALGISIAVALEALKAFDQFSFTQPKELQRNREQLRGEGVMVDVECESGPTFRAWYVNDWGGFYITRFQAHRQVVGEYERAMQEWRPKTMTHGTGTVARP